jgi:hypothetical protein
MQRLQSYVVEPVGVARVHVETWQVPGWSWFGPAF